MAGQDKDQAIVAPGAGGGRACGLYERMCSLPVLREAWARVQRNNGSAGDDGMSVARFGLVAEAQLERLSRLLLAGQYRPGPARRVFIRKKGGAGLRQLDIPCVVDRVAQAAAALVLDPVLDPLMEPSSFAYRRGRSVAQAVARVASLRRQGFTHVVDADIEDYFGSIPHERLIARLERDVDDARLVDLVWTWLEAYSLIGRGVAQGSPLSPLLANLYLDDVDGKIADAGLKLVRFADDFLVLARSSVAAEGGLDLVRHLLAGEGLALNVEKSRLVTFEQGFRFLGHIFVRSVVVREVGEDDTPQEDAVAAAELAAKQADEAEQEDDEPPGDHARMLRPVYIVEPGRRLEAMGGRLRLVEDGVRIIDLPPGRYGRFEIGPGSDATLEALDLAAAHGADVLKVDGQGAVLARYEAVGAMRAALHLAQAALVLDPPRRAALARSVVAARLHNQRALLRRLNRERRDGEMADAAARISRIIQKLTLPLDVAAAMGVEGEAAALYWPALARAVPDGMASRHRRRHPAPDPFNATVNALSHLLARDVRAMAERVGLHTGFGVLHTARDGHEALVYDLMEALRAPVAEACAAALFNRRALTAQHVTMERDGHCQITREGWKAILRGYEAWVNRAIVYPATGDRMLWRHLMLEEARAYARAAAEGGDFRPYRMDY